MEKIKKIPKTFLKIKIKNLFKFFSDKMIFYECYDKNENLIAIRGSIYHKDKAWEVLAAASNDARKFYATYATEWAVIEDSSKNGVKLYDLTGADPENNYGVYFFKKGTGAKLVKCLGEWEFSKIPFYRYLIYLRFKLIFLTKLFN